MNTPGGGELPDVGGQAGPDTGVERMRIRISGLTCAGDAARVERHLTRVPGVVAATVNPLTETAYVAFDPREADRGGLEGAVAAAGYGVG